MYGLDDAETTAAISALRGGGTAADFPDRVAQARDSIQHLFLTDTRAAFEAVETMPPDVRVQIRP